MMCVNFTTICERFFGGKADGARSRGVKSTAGYVAVFLVELLAVCVFIQSSANAAVKFERVDLNKKFTCEFRPQGKVVVYAKGALSTGNQPIRAADKRDRKRLRKLKRKCLALNRPGSPGSPEYLGFDGYGLQVADANYEIGADGRFLTTVNVPLPKALSRYLRSESDYVFTLGDPTAPGGAVYAEQEVKAYYHLTDGAAPRVVSLRAPLDNDTLSNPVIHTQIRIRHRNDVAIPNFNLSASASELLNNGSVRVTLPGTQAGWLGEIPLNACPVAYQGVYSKRLACSVKLRPDSAFPNQVETGLSAQIFVTAESGSEFLQLELLLSNSNIGGSYDTPVQNGKLEVLLNGSVLQLAAKNITFPGDSAPYYRHQLTSTAFYFIPQAPSGSTHFIQADALLSFPDVIAFRSSSERPEGEQLAASTRVGVVQSEPAPDPLPIVANWLEAPIERAAIPNANEFFSQTQLQSRAGELRTRLYPNHTGSTGSAFGIDWVNPSFYAQFAGPNSLSMAGGVGLQFINEAQTLAANLNRSGLRNVIEAIEAHTRAFSNRSPISLMFDEQGLPLTAEQLLARAGGEAIHTGSEWRLHSASDFNPNSVIQQTQRVQSLIAEAQTAPYYQTVTRTYGGGADRQHSIRGFDGWFMNCFVVPNAQCEAIQRAIGEAIVAFRVDPGNRDNLSNFYETSMREAAYNASRGIYGSILGRAQTDTMWLSLKVMKSESVSNLVLSRINLLLSAVNISMSGMHFFADTDKVDPRDFTEVQMIDSLTVACREYGLTECNDPFYGLLDSEARALYCHDEPDPQNPGRNIQVCNWPAPHRAAPNSERTEALNRAEVRRVGYWEGVYTFGEISRLVALMRDVSELRSVIDDSVANIQEHLAYFNESCGTGRPMDECAFNQSNQYGWIGMYGRVDRPFSDSDRLRLTNFSISAGQYAVLSAIEASLEFEVDPANGYQTFSRIVPTYIDYSGFDVFDPWRAPTMALFQKQAFSGAFH